MKKKHLNIVLVPLVLFIYGAVFLKIFGKKQVVIEDTNHNYGINSSFSEIEIKRISFDINTLEKDPFKIDKKSKKRPSTSSSKKPTNSKALKVNSIKQSWPRIDFYGFVKNDLSSTKLALIKLDNTIYRKREGQVIGDISIIKVYNDSIKIKFKNEHKIITRRHE